MAHKKAAGSSNNGRESHSKRLGVKLFGGQSAIAGNIIIRQRGTKYHPGTGVGIGKDHTIFAMTDGIVTFSRMKKNKPVVSVIAPESAPKKVAPKPKAAATKTEAPKVVAKASTAEAKTPAKKATPTKKAAPKKKAE